MTGQDGGFSQAAARFSAEVDRALTRAKRAAREARAVTEDFRRRTGELGAQAKTGKLRGLRRGAVAPTSPLAREEAEKFRSANGLPLDELPDADALLDRLPGPAPEAVRENEDFSQHQVLFDIDGPGGPDGPAGPAGPNGPGAPAETGQEHDFDDHFEDDRDDDSGGETAGIDSQTGRSAHSSDDEEDFSQQRILHDATVESYRPDGMPGSVFGDDESEETRSEPTSRRRGGGRD
jgi:hypothetical protein